MRPSSLVSAFAAASVVAVSCPARADVPLCAGSDPGIASRQFADGKQHYRHALAQVTVDVDEMRTALLEFDAACAAGDGMVLEPRAYALFALKRYVDAAESLDAFLKAHPLETLPKDIRDRVVSQRSTILANVVTLHVVTDPPGAQVSVGGHLAGLAPIDIRLLPNASVDVAVAAPGFEKAGRTITLGADAVHDESFAMQRVGGTLTIDAPEGADVSVDGQPVGRTPLSPLKHATGPVDISLTFPGGQPLVRRFDLVAGEEHVEHFAIERPAAHHAGSLTKWSGVTGGASIAMLGAGIGFAVWRANRTSTYDASCLTSPQPSGCSATLAQFDAAQASEITAFSLSGALAVTAVVLWVMDRKTPPQPANSGIALTCAPGLGIMCSGRF